MTPERSYWRYSGVFFLNLNRFRSLFWCLRCYLWTIICRLRGSTNIKHRIILKCLCFLSIYEAYFALKSLVFNCQKSFIMFSLFSSLCKYCKKYASNLVNNLKNRYKWRNFYYLTLFLLSKSWYLLKVNSYDTRTKLLTLFWCFFLKFE